MKKNKMIFVLAVVATILIGMSIQGCQKTDDHYPSTEEAPLTEVDLFIASEAYQNMEKEIIKDIRRRQNAIDRLSKDVQVWYRQLMEELTVPETRTEAQKQLNNLLGYDYNLPFHAFHIDIFYTFAVGHLLSANEKRHEF